MSERPKPMIPDNLDAMTPRQAWNAALDAIEPMLGWEAFWNDGRDTDTAPYRVDEVMPSRDGGDFSVTRIRSFLADQPSGASIVIGGYDVVVGLRRAIAALDAEAARVDELRLLLSTRVESSRLDSALAGSAALALIIEQVRAMAGLLRPWNVTPEQVENLGRILDTAPSAALVAAHDAEVWERGRVAGGSVAMRRMSDEPGAPDAVNPYRAVAVPDEATS